LSYLPRLLSNRRKVASTRLRDIRNSTVDTLADVGEVVVATPLRDVGFSTGALHNRGQVVVAVRLSDLRVSEHARVRLRHAGGVIAAILVDERVTLIAQLRNESLRARGSSSLRDGGFVQITDLSY